MEIIVPAYCYPEKGKGYWEGLASAAQCVPVTVIMNPHNGPGKSVDENYRWAHGLVRSAGAKVIGYIHTSYTKRPLAEVERDVDQFLSFYPDIQGFFVDETTNDHDSSNIQYYRELRDFIRSRSAHLEVTGNPGCDASPDYIRLNLFDKLVISETPTNFAQPSFPQWLREHSASTFSAMVYDISSKDRMKELVRDCVRAHIGAVYVTDAKGGNPYDRLPGYWRDLVAFVQEINSSPDAVKLIHAGAQTGQMSGSCCRF